MERSGEEKPRIDIHYVANLARLELSREEIERFGPQLEQIVRFVEKIRELDLRDVEPLAHPLPLTNVMRADEVRETMSREDALGNAPERSSELFLVPRVVE